MRSNRIRLISLLAVAALMVGSQLTIAAGATANRPVSAAAASDTAVSRGIDCGNGRFLCPEIPDSDDAFGHYVGHDEPALMFSSHVRGSGNRMQYSGILPKEPAPTNVPGAANYDFQLMAAFWFGMAVCDTQSYPNTMSTCIPDSDKNIRKAGDPYHPGTALMELQFYPPGYVQAYDGYNCSATQWCASLTISSYGKNPLTGQELNPTCRSRVGVEYQNFAYLTHDGIPQGPPNALNFDPLDSGTPNPAKVEFLSPGDHYTVTMHDTEHGLQIVLHDTSNNTTGSMTASAANGFAQVKYDPTGTSCENLPYDFHPEYSTSTPETTVGWTAATLQRCHRHRDRPLRLLQHGDRRQLQLQRQRHRGCRLRPRTF